MIKLNIERTNISASCLETLVEGNVNSILAEFTFSPEWDNLSRIAVFSNGTSKVSVALSENTCAIPWETLSCPGELLIAVRGVGDSGNLVICTGNASLGKVIESLADDDADTPQDATPSVIDTLIADVAELKSGSGYGSSTNDYDDTEKQKVAAAYADKHAHSNKGVLDGITAEQITSWSAKQDSISDLAAIRSNASAGAAKVSCTDAAVGSFGYTKVTDSHINDLIDTKLGVIENGNY